MIGCCLTLFKSGGKGTEKLRLIDFRIKKELTTRLGGILSFSIGFEKICISGFTFV